VDRSKWVLLGAASAAVVLVACMAGCLVMLKTIAPRAGAARTVFESKSALPGDADEATITPAFVGAFERADLEVPQPPIAFDADVAAVYGDGRSLVCFYHKASPGANPDDLWNELKRAVGRATVNSISWNAGDVRSIRGTVRDTKESIWAWESRGSMFVVTCPEIETATDFVSKYPY